MKIGIPGKLDTQLDDMELARLAKGGSLDALGALYERHGPAVYSAAYRLLASAADAEDVRQDVFAGLPAALRHYDERGTLAPWLCRIAVRRSLILLRRGRLERSAPFMAAGSAQGTIDATHVITAREAISALPEALRVVFVLKEVEGYPHQEIGNLLGISARASALRLHRAWKTLRQRLGGP